MKRKLFFLFWNIWHSDPVLSLRTLVRIFVKRKKESFFLSCCGCWQWLPGHLSPRKREVITECCFIFREFLACWNLTDLTRTTVLCMLSISYWNLGAVNFPSCSTAFLLIWRVLGLRRAELNHRSWLFLNAMPVVGVALWPLFISFFSLHLFFSILMVCSFE